MKRLLALALIGLSGCGITGTSDDTGEGALSSAWNRYAQQDYDGALAAFSALLDTGGLYPEASEGQGWCQLMLGQATPAALAFRQALLADDERNSARVGEAFARRDSSPPDYPRVIQRAREALRRDPDFRFSHDTHIDWRDLHLLMAQTFFYQQALDSCLVHCRAVDSGLTLSRTDTLSWGASPTFELALFSTLLELGSATAP
ncbi:MAG: hypothetical protein H6678_08135 [Candidatus Delongbacteria bacterium]|nr:hypothetical protein [Candidatus Delongbacteria bacterium]